jgi:hypothetical protein
MLSSKHLLSSLRPCWLVSLCLGDAVTRHLVPPPNGSLHLHSSITGVQGTKTSTKGKNGASTSKAAAKQVEDDETGELSDADKEEFKESTHDEEDEEPVKKKKKIQKKGTKTSAKGKTGASTSKAGTKQVEEDSAEEPVDVKKEEPVDVEKEELAKSRYDEKDEEPAKKKRKTQKKGNESAAQGPVAAGADKNKAAGNGKRSVVSSKGEGGKGGANKTGKGCASYSMLQLTHSQHPVLTSRSLHNGGSSLCIPWVPVCDG